MKYVNLVVSCKHIKKFCKTRFGIFKMTKMAKVRPCEFKLRIFICLYYWSSRLKSCIIIKLQAEHLFKGNNLREKQVSQVLLKTISCIIFMENAMW
jgi:hypothetical protein